VRLTTTIVCCAGGLMLAPAAAQADGGPISPMQGGRGVSAPRSTVRYVALAASGSTVVKRSSPSGAVRRSAAIRGRFGVPVATYDGSATGLSADRRRLVLAQVLNRYPPRRTRLVELDARRMRVIGTLSLPGYFTVDAISPKGRWLYLLHYTHSRNLLRYEVRAYDLRARRLVRRPVVDPREPDEAMRGIAASRVTSTDGRWAYTLYIRPSGAPFVHALDTQRRTAACIDLPQLRDADPSTLRLTLNTGGGALQVMTPAGHSLLIDTGTLAVTDLPVPTPDAPAAPTHINAQHRGDSDSGGPRAWLTAAITLTALLLLAAAARARRGRTAST
jgi:hypothetical protein